MGRVEPNEIKINFASAHMPAKDFYLLFNLFDHFSSQEGESPASQADDLNLMS